MEFLDALTSAGFWLPYLMGFASAVFLASLWKMGRAVVRPHAPAPEPAGLATRPVSYGAPPWGWMEFRRDLLDPRVPIGIILQRCDGQVPEKKKS